MLFTYSSGGATLPYLHDNVSDNISEKNPTYCELTALYWGWKNIKAEYKGLCHYRRYLGKNYFAMDSYKNIFTEQELEKLLVQYDVLLPEAKYRGLNNSWYPTEEALNNDRAYKVIKEAMEQICPDYINPLKTVFMNKKMFFCNVIIAKAEIYDEYCSWLFALQDEIECILIKNGGVQPREMGFISEWLLNVFIEKNKNRFSIMHSPLARVDRKKDIKQFILTILERTKLLYLAEKIKYEVIYLQARK